MIDTIGPNEAEMIVHGAEWTPSSKQTSDWYIFSGVRGDLS